MPVPLSVEKREALTSSPERQNEAHGSGAYDYLNSIHLAPRYGVIAAYVESLGVESVFDIGCGQGNLRPYLKKSIEYVGIEVSAFAVQNACRLYGHFPTTTFTLKNINTDISGLGKKDCSIWAGVGMGCLESEDDLGGWSKIINKMSQLTNENGVLIIECIQSYKTHIGQFVERLTLISECNLTCLSTPDHPSRHIYALRNST